MAKGLDEVNAMLCADKGAVLEIKHWQTAEVLRHDDGRPFTITLLGRDAEKLVSLSRRQVDAHSARRARTNQPVPVEALEKDLIDMAVAATVEWDVILGGEKAPCAPAAYRAAYSQYPWLFEQVSEFIGNRGNFTTTPAQT